MWVLTYLSGVSVCTNAIDPYDCDIYKGADVFLPGLGELSLVGFNFSDGCVCVCVCIRVCVRTIRELYDVDVL